MSELKTYRYKSIRNLFFSFLNIIVTCFLGFLLPKLFVVNYGSDMNGLISLSGQIFSCLALLEAGIGTSALQSMYKVFASDDKNKINSILAAMNFYYKKIAFIYFVLLIFISLFVPFCINTTISYPIIFFIFFILGMVNVFSFYSQAKFKILLQADGKQYVTSNISLCIYIVTSVAKIVLINLKFSVIFVLSITTFIEIMQNILISVYIKYNYLWIDFNVKPDYNSLKDNKFVIVHQISGLIFNNTDIILISLFCNLAYVSVYTIYKSFINQIRMITSIIENSFAFVLGQVFNVDKDLYLKLIDSFDLVFTMFNHYILSIFCVVFIPFMTLYTNSFPDANLYVNEQLLLLFVSVELLSGYRNAMRMSINFNKHFQQTIKQSIFESILNILFSILLVNYFGINGVLLGTIIALIYRSNDIIIYGNKRILKRSPKKSYRIYISNMLIFIFLYVFKEKIFINSSNYIVLLMSTIKVSLIYGVVYLFFNVLFNYKSIIDFITYILRKNED
ncbi:hypothetical protein [uncultured Holdemania sp.]|uniref:lipopolysaccharide biosynthesis protein n=1 Tax=uncultured Holdemania sp. TaxID=527664 RepID=UPI0028054F61|nr:hypothetical protein [uncultured Holdemania sp.]